MRRTLAGLAFVALRAVSSSVADDVGDTPASAESLAAGPAVTRTIEWDIDRDWFVFGATPYVTCTVVVATGTIWDCEADLVAESGSGLLAYTNTIHGPSAVSYKSTTTATRIFLHVRALAEFTTGTYTLAISEAFTDSDGDGLPDEWEDGRFGTLTNSPSGDADADGLPNRDELLAGTHPALASSGLRITGMKRETNWIVVTWQSVPDGRYRVSQSVVPPAAWTGVSDPEFAASNQTSRAVADPNTGSVYRVELLY